MECLASGKKEWVDIAVELAQYSDAGASEDIDIYLGKALSNNAEYVLRVALPEGMTDFCDALDNDPPETFTDAQLDKWYIDDLNHRLIGLTRVRSPDLHEKADNCRNQINTEIETLKDDIKKHS